ncbi:sulfurtransferase [Pandoraea terrae]|uniref:Sulfurtransferase n=1 Tax=Pandoraea terrae TaxID=1537710 RepID=A0A5E4SMJ2_9BURK|nr:rhodanese-like domain-containing protein [Pandoraea terrae]VVD76183.1 sulfurtransferase [Pandoraea terrae]
MTSFVTAKNLKAWLHDGAEIALFDVREHGQYGEAHLFYGVPLPYSRLEIDIPRVAPRKTVRLVVYDTDATVAVRAADRLTRMGYTAVHVLEGGTQAWTQAGLALFAGVNVPSKTFGELVELQYHTPRVTARQLAEMQANGSKVVVVDGRPFSEYLKMTIPGSICCPNGELGYRIDTLAPDADTTIVVNCAGRTRSIIGAQTLINLGVPNRVMALENGTQGWFLEDFALEHGSTRRYGATIADDTLPARRAASARLAARAAVPTVDAATLASWASEGMRSVFLCDVRTPEEFAMGSLPGAQHTPGGQLIQATDQYVGVRHARLVLFDSDGIRAPIVASWLRQLGHDAHVLQNGLASGASVPPLIPAALPALAAVTAQQLADGIKAGAMRVLDVRSSMAYRHAHLPGAAWGVRPRLPAIAASFGDAHVVIIADEPRMADLAATEWENRGTVSVLAGGIKAWRDAGLPVEATPDLPADADCIDYLFFVHDRHDGNKAAARQYLAWETGLLAQLDRQERDAFKVGLKESQS